MRLEAGGSVEINMSEFEQQEHDFAKLLQSLGQASFEEIEKIMQEREASKPEKGLSPEVVKRPAEQDK